MDEPLEINADTSLVLELGGEAQSQSQSAEQTEYELPPTQRQRNYQHVIDKWSVRARSFVEDTEKVRKITAVIPGEKKITHEQRALIRVVESKAAWEKNHQQDFLQSAKQFHAVTIDTEGPKGSPVLLILGTLDGCVWILDLRKWKEELKSRTDESKGSEMKESKGQKTDELQGLKVGEPLPTELKEFLQDPKTIVGGSAVSEEQGEIGIKFGQLFETQDWILWLDERGGTPYRVPEIARQRGLKGLEIVQFSEYGYHTKSVAFFTKDVFGEKGQNRWSIFQMPWPYKNRREARFRAGIALYCWPEKLPKVPAQLLYCANDAWSVTQLMRRMMIQALVDERSSDTEDPYEWLHAVRQLDQETRDFTEDKPNANTVEEFFKEARAQAAEDQGLRACLDELEIIIGLYQVLGPQVEALVNTLLSRPLWASIPLLEGARDDQEVLLTLTNTGQLFQGAACLKLMGATYSEAEEEFVQVQTSDAGRKLKHGRQSNRSFGRRTRLGTETDADPKQPWRCAFCGRANHLKQHLNGTPVCHIYQEALRLGDHVTSMKVIKCAYPLCPDRTEHCTGICPTLAHLCQRCFRRGHLEIGCQGREAYAAAECLKHLFSQFREHHVLTVRAGWTETTRVGRQLGNMTQSVNLAFGFWRVPLNLSREELALGELEPLSVREAESLLIERCSDAPIYDAGAFFQKYNVRSREEWLGRADVDKREKEQLSLIEKRTRSPSRESGNKRLALGLDAKPRRS